MFHGVFHGRQRAERGTESSRRDCDHGCAKMTAPGAAEPSRAQIFTVGILAYSSGPVKEKRMRSGLLCRDEVRMREHFAGKLAFGGDESGAGPADRGTRW